MFPQTFASYQSTVHAGVIRVEFYSHKKLIVILSCNFRNPFIPKKCISPLCLDILGFSIE